MKKIEITGDLLEYDSAAELNTEERNLLEQAATATRTAYAPYSGFHVGAAILLENGKIVCGNNQENAAYPSGLCAERVAMFSAASHYPGVAVNAIAVTCSSNKFEVSEPLTPCGACRQVLLEYERLQGKNIRVILAGSQGKVWVLPAIKVLLPLAFSESRLKKD